MIEIMVGRCKSCRYAVAYTEHGETFYECRNPMHTSQWHLDRGIGIDKDCLDWEMQEIHWCKKHQLWHDDWGCPECELEATNKTEG